MSDLAPSVIGRMLDDELLDERAETTLIASATVPYVGGAVGQVTVQAFKSLDEMDRGGIVLRVTTEDDTSSFIAHARDIEGGAELHLAGDIERQSLVKALKELLEKL